MKNFSQVHMMEVGAPASESKECIENCVVSQRPTCSYTHLHRYYLEGKTPAILFETRLSVGPALTVHVMPKI